MHPILSFGACESSFIDKVRHGLGYLEELNENHHLVACKPLPNSPNQMVVAIARRQEGTEIGDSETMGNYNLDISLVSEATGKTIIHKFIKQRFFWDGTGFDGIEIDTAKYSVSTGLRAFGIRADYHTGTRLASNQTLSLFIVDGKEIREVLTDANMNIAFHTNYPQCSANESREATRTLAIGTEKTNGFNNLLVTEVLVDSESEEDSAGECNQKVKKREIRKYILRFDGNKYVVPEEMKGPVCRVC